MRKTKNNIMKTVSFEELPKYLMIDTGEDYRYYHPIIFKWEWEGWQNAYYAMYARYYPKSGNLNPKQALFHVTAPTYEEALEEFLHRYDEEKRFIKGKIWTGGNPEVIDYTNRAGRD